MTFTPISPLSTLFYSIAGKRKNDKINSELINLLDYEKIPNEDKDTINYTLEVTKHGSYPSREYYQNQGYTEIDKTNSLSEILTLENAIREFFRYNYLQGHLLSYINESDGATNLLEKVSNLIEKEGVELTDESLDEYETQIPENLEIFDKESSFETGISEVDEITKNFQPGTLALFAAFTGHGKSTIAVSSTFRNLAQNKKGLFITLEVPHLFVLVGFFVRWLYEFKGIDTQITDVLAGKFEDGVSEKIPELRSEFNTWVKERLVIIDEKKLTKKVLTNYKLLQQIYKLAEIRLGSLDFVIYDHLSMLERMLTKDVGNEAIRTIMSAGKLYVNSKGKYLVTVGCAQTNREGNKRAEKNKGSYDLQALADLNELERSASYVVFLYTSDDMKLLQETKVQLVKNRMSLTMLEPVTVAFNPEHNIIGEMIKQPEFEQDFSFIDVNSSLDSQTSTSLGSLGDFDDI